jgi:alpha,alpha-trehalose phosphorylase
VAVAGFGGLRDHDGELTFAPRLPERLTRLRFRVLFQGRCIMVTVEKDRATYRLSAGDPFDIRHHGRQVTVDHSDLTLDIPPAPKVDPVHQPPGAAPRRRSRPESD